MVGRVRQALVADVLGALNGEVMVPPGVNPPGWLNGTPAGENVVNTPTGVLDLAALADGRPDAVRPPTPLLFTTTKTGTGYDPAAPPPVAWLKFLNDLWPDDPDSVACLQQWFGYLLTPDTRQQKMLLLVGPTRSGKGTIANVLRALLGEGAVAGPTLNSLSTNFGLSTLLTASVAIVDDARLSGRADTATVAERLLTITGEGVIDVDRKHLPPVAGAKLGTRFVVISNELPKLGDASGALVGRMIVLRFTKSFYGREDHGLLTRLKGELPGILNWSIDGWKALRERGHFVQPGRGRELVEELHDLSSPVGAFVREKCRTGPGLTVSVPDLFRAWKLWCDASGKREAGTEQTFGRDLRAVVPDLEQPRPWVNGVRVRKYAGIALRPDDIADRFDATPADATPDAPPATPEPARSAHRSASGPHAGPHENAGNPSVVRMVRTTSDSSTCGGEEGEEGERNKGERGPRGPRGPAPTGPAALVLRLLSDGPRTEPDLVASFRAAGYVVADLDAALKATGATNASDAEFNSVWAQG